MRTTAASRLHRRPLLLVPADVRVVPTTLRLPRHDVPALTLAMVATSCQTTTPTSADIILATATHLRVMSPTTTWFPKPLRVLLSPQLRPEEISAKERFLPSLTKQAMGEERTQR